MIVLEDLAASIACAIIGTAILILCAIVGLIRGSHRAR